MLALPELQGRLAEAIVTGRTVGLDAEIADDGIPWHRRIQIYRNHYRITLAEALAATFPAVQRLVGDACFGSLARRFVRLSPPAGPCLFEYGAGFPYFLSKQPELQGLACAADLARLEWAMNEALHAPDLPALSAERSSRLGPERLLALGFAFHPAWRLVASRWPLLAIWRACRSDAPENETVRLDAGETRLLVGRDRDGDVVQLELDRARWIFVRWLKAGRSLGDAVTAALGTGLAFDPAGTLALLIDGGVLLDPLTHEPENLP